MEGNDVTRKGFRIAAKHGYASKETQFKFMCESVNEIKIWPGMIVASKHFEWVIKYPDESLGAMSMSAVLTDAQV